MPVLSNEFCTCATPGTTDTEVPKTKLPPQLRPLAVVLQYVPNKALSHCKSSCTRTIFNLQRFVRRKRKDRPELGPPWTANHPGVAVILTIDSHIEVAKKPHSYHNKQRQVGASVLWSPWEHASCWPCSWPASRMLIWAGIWPPKTP